MVFSLPLAVCSNVQRKTWEIAAGLVSKQAEERCVPHQTVRPILYMTCIEGYFPLSSYA